MRVSGFTFIRNAIEFDYPIVEAIKSIEPLCDEIIVAVGKSADNTLKLIEGIGSEKIKIIQTVWDDSLREGGRVLALETDKAKAAIDPRSDWAVYIQGDEVMHEAGHEAVREAMQRWKDDERVEGLVFDYRHFYGSYDYVADSSNWYKKEVRVIKNNPQIYSFRDAQGFQLKGRPLKVKAVNAHIHHYGWVKDPRAQQKKQRSFNKMWHDDAWVEKNVEDASEFDYSGVSILTRFTGDHPKVMQPRIASMNWTFDRDLSLNRSGLKERVKRFAFKKFGWELGYKNYRII